MWVYLFFSLEEATKKNMLEMDREELIKFVFKDISKKKMFL